MAEVHSKCEWLRVLRWALHRRISMESVKQECQRCHSSQHPHESTVVLGALGRICIVFTTCAWDVCDGIIGTTSWMRLLEWWKNEVHDQWYKLYYSWIWWMHVWFEIPIQRCRHSHQETMEDRIVGGFIPWLAWEMWWLTSTWSMCR